MTIKESIEGDKKKFYSISIDDLIEACQRLGIPAKDENYNLSDEELRKLQYSTYVHKTYVVNEVKSAHKTLTDKYESLIKRYKDLSKRMENVDYLSGSKTEIDKLISQLEKAKEGYDNVLTNITIDDKSIGFDQNVLNPVDSIIMGIDGKKIQKVDDKLASKYQKLDELRRKDYKTKFKNKINEKRINRVASKISRLQSKKGKLQTTQKKIVNRGSEKYKKRKEREWSRFDADVRRYEAYTDMRMGLEQDKLNYNADILTTKNEILTSKRNERNLVGALKRFKNNVDIVRMSTALGVIKLQEKSINRLRVKEGRCKLGEQFYRTVGKTLTA